MSTNMQNDMNVIKRDGKKEEISFDKILTRVKKLGEEANLSLNYSSLVMKVIEKLCNNIHTTQIDLETADQCAALSTKHPDYGTLAGRILISNHQKNTDSSFSKTAELLHSFVDEGTKLSVSLISDKIYEIIRENADDIDAMIVHDRDYLIDYFGFKTLERSYLFSVNGKVLERPQYMWMRVAIGIHGSDLEAVKETYDLMSLKYFTHATPTLFNAGTNHPQMSSCYLIGMESDSLDGIYNTLHDCASISKWAGGVGLHIHNIRATGTHIRGTNGTSTGIVPMLKVFNDTARYIDQGSRRKGSFAIYLEPWHADIADFLDLKKNHGDENMKARDLFYALWIPDLFMERVKSGGQWTLMCPHKCPNLSKVYGDDFNALYTEYEAKNMGNKTIPARELWYKILDAQMETGTPYLLYKDAVNKKSNQKNIGTIMSSNLCVAPETLVLTSKGHLEIQTLVDKEVDVWNGKEWSEVTVRKTGTNQELMRVETTDGCVLECTLYHRFYIKAEDKGVKTMEARELYPGDELIDWEYPEMIGDVSVIKQSTEPNRDKKEPVKVRSITMTGRKDDTYCFNEPKEHAGIFNGMITSQCTEIMEYSDDKETAVCNLASIALPTCVNANDKTFDYDKLHEITKVITNNLNNVIDINYYPTIKTKLSNLLHRPIGIGVQGLADTFIMMNVAFHSDEAKEINKLIFETIYHAALEKSNEIAKDRQEKINNEMFSKELQCMSPHIVSQLMKWQYLENEKDLTPLTEIHFNDLHNVLYRDIFSNYPGAYSSFAGSPACQGILQFDMWNVVPSSNRYDWTALKESIQKYGLRNSLLVAPMPTASTSQILGFNECFEPFTSNIYKRGTLAGEFTIVNKYLMNELIEQGIWSDDIKNNIIANGGSVQQLPMLSDQMKNKYKTVWEIPMRHIIDMAADRGAYICQSQSMNLWVQDPNYGILNSMHFHSWQKGLKTGIYYLRRKAKHQTQQFTIEPEKKAQNYDQEEEVCTTCSA